MNPTSKQILCILPHVRYEIESLLLSPIYDSTNKELVESIEFRRMAHARALYVFFTKKKRANGNQSSLKQDDDVLCCDLGFPPVDHFYASDREKERKLLDRFNKDLFHLTYDRLNRTPQNKAWPREKLLPPIIQRSNAFIDYIISQKTFVIEETERQRWIKLKTDIQSNAPLQQNTSNVAPSQVFSIEL